MPGLNLLKISSAQGAAYTSNTGFAPVRNFVKDSLGFTPSLDRPATKSNFTSEQLCGAPLIAEKLDLMA